MFKKTIILTTIMTLASCSHYSFGKREIASWGGDRISTQDVYPYRVHIDKNHDMRIINNGIAALYQRLDMIKRAKETLELEYFIFNPDTSGRLVVKELIKATKRGVKVRILVDKSMAVFVLDEFYAKVLKDNNIEIRYYNSASALRISSVQFRNHRKLIVRDGVEAITGGRNIADEYFNLALKFNFLDRDVWVQGDIVKPMRETFNLYWESKIVEIPKALKAPEKNFTNYENETSEEASYQYKLKMFADKLTNANQLVSENDEDDKVYSYVMDMGAKTLIQNNIYQCPNVAFATDREGASFFERLKSDDYNTNYRLLRKEIANWMGLVDDEIILDSPYFLNDKNSQEILTNLFNAKKKVTILTNSLSSTDAIYVSTVFNDSLKQQVNNPNFNAYVYKGLFSGESELMNDEIKKSQWGTHSKTILYNDDSFMVGTFNIDHRSNFYNTEMALFCTGSPELAHDVKESIQTRMKMSHHINEKGRPDDGSPLLDGNSLQKKTLYFFLKIPSTLAQFLL
jgi:putative cardiolipin synthase